MSEQFRPVHRRLASLATAMALCLNAGVAAQQPPAGPAAKPLPAPAPAAPPAVAAAPAAPAAQAAAPPAPAYSYSPEGRRDPFISLAGRGSDGKPTGARPPGVAGLMINEIGIKGIVRDHSGFIAMVQGADNRTYVIRAGDRLMDGTVKAIVQDAVVFSQDVNDPLSLVKQKEIRKNMRSPEGGRG
jgi:Tfp pilus assembly protein PilP